MSDPVLRHEGSFLWLFWRRHAGKTPHQLFIRVVNFQLNVSGSIGRQNVIQDGAIGRIFSRRNFRRQRRVLILIAAHTDGGSWRKEMRARRCYPRIRLAKRRDIVENPERPAIRRGH